MNGMAWDFMVRKGKFWEKAPELVMHRVVKQHLVNLEHVKIATV